MIQLSCTLSAPTTPLPHVWEHTVGSGHAALALRADWQEQLARCHRELGFQHVRFHGLLSHPIDPVICENNMWLYSLFNIDQIMDFLASIGMRPFVELSFMPAALASGTTTVFRYQANVTLPKDYSQWKTLIQLLARHWIDRYGSAEVHQWFFEVWNEPNLTAFGSGKQDDYFALYRATMDAIKGVDPALRIGGPATAKSDWVDAFVAFCDRERLTADFITTHQYPTDAFGSPGDDTETQLAKSTPGIMRTQAEHVRNQANGRPLYYTEWNTSSNPRDPLHDEPFAAAFATGIVLDVCHIVNGYSYWTFSDIFDENYMPSVPFQGGFGLLTIHGVAKPTYRAFEILHRLGSEQYAVQGSHETVRAWVVRREESVTIVLVNHALPRHPIKQESVHMTLTDAPDVRYAYLERIDQHHANAKQAWLAMGSPQYPNALQLEQMHAASRLRQEPVETTARDRTIHIDLDIEPHAIAAITIELISRQSNPARNHV